MLLLDTASLYFRAFFGVPDSVTAPDGTPVNAIRGLLEFITRLLGEYPHRELVCAWDDDWRPRWRVDLVPSYKAHRVASETPAGGYVEEVPDLLTAQIPVIREVLDALGVAVVGAAGYEADDVIGTLCARAPADGSGPVDVVTGDRDLFQVVDDARGVRVLYVARGVARHERVTDAVVVARYGVHAAQYADFATLRGDASDGLPGVAGVGEKTAARLLAEHGDLAGIVARSGNAKIAAAAGYLAVAPTVVRVATDIALPETDLTTPRAAADAARLDELAQRWGLQTPVRRLLTTFERTARITA